MIKTLLNILCPALGLAKGMNVAAAAIGGAVVGGVASNMAAGTQADGQKAAAEAANSPWSKAQPYISGEFQPAQDALNNALGMGVYSGSRVASLNPYQTQGADSAAAYANGNGLNTANLFYNTGTGMTNAGAGYGTNAQSLFQQAQQDPTQGFLSTASQYANNPYVDGLIDSANRDVSRDLNETQLPSLAVGAAGNGNTDSTRTGVASAILQRGAADRMADTASNIRSQFFNQGLQTAQTQYNANADRALNANQQVGNAFQLGGAALLNGQQANGNNFDQLQAAGGVFQNQDQANINADMQKFNEQQQTPLNLIGQYMNVINGSWGGQAVNPVGPNSTAASIQGALGGAAMGAGMAGKLGGYSNTGGGSTGYNFSMPEGYSATPASDSMQIPAGLSAFGYGS
ncbi:hypothetical protein PTKU64_21830 [Paraburkholderia terrae]|uniref:DNA transfer protein p32 n=1 Tax=Paraburkholderia terrae TaxID=311230 RepID=A0ABM7TJU0_9BURK|nr:hypothetical protein [Paraburkholderia terrae]BCZ78508.1 hypothetical protein PTKU64_21830 [Paraburkholderia terrae]